MSQEFIAQILEALTVIHAEGLMHRDVKPANILVQYGERMILKLADFGLCKDYRTTEPSHTGKVSILLTNERFDFCQIERRCVHTTDRNIELPSSRSLDERQWNVRTGSRHMVRWSDFSRDDHGEMPICDQSHGYGETRRRYYSQNIQVSLAALWGTTTVNFRTGKLL